MREEETEKISLARVGTVINGKWTVDQLIGVGGMASVYAATHRNSKRAALKIMHPELSAQATIRERFLREGYLSNMVDHPGVVSIDDDDITEDGCAYLVMELVEGETLEARLRRKGPLPPEEVLSFMDQVLHALATAHTRGVVHRDLKPENMLLAQNGEVKLLDFGIARARALSTDPTKTLTEGLMGTPAFMPPEQARGRWEEVDAQSDVWALGATMFTLLTGRNVHQAATTNEALAVAMMRHAPRLEEYRPELPSSLLELVNKALAFDKKDRWPNATVMLLAVRKSSSRLEDETLEAEAEAAALAVHSDSQPELFFAEPEVSETSVERLSEPEISDAEHTQLLSRSSALPSHSNAPAVLPSEPPTNPVSSQHPFAVEHALRASVPAAEIAQSTRANEAAAEARRAMPAAPTLVAIPRREQPSRPPEQPSRPPPRAAQASRPPEQPSRPPPRPPARRDTESSPLPEPLDVPPALGFGEAASLAVASLGPENLVEASVASGQALAVGESPSSAPTFEVFSPVPPPISSTPTSPAPFAQGDHAAGAADSALPARRIVQFSDVPVAGAVVTRPTDTTTARSALTAATSVPSRHPWSLVGAGVAVLLLLILVMATTGGDDEPRAAVGASAGSEDSRVDAVDQVEPSPPPVVAPTPAKKRTVNRRSAAAASPKADSTAVKRPVRSAAVGQSVDLEALPVLSADADAPSEPSARAAATTAQVRSTSKPAGKTNTNIFNQAKNLAQKRATQRSGQVQTGSGD